jgi:hypothetical protein
MEALLLESASLVTPLPASGGIVFDTNAADDITYNPQSASDCIRSRALYYNPYSSVELEKLCQSMIFRRFFPASPTRTIRLSSLK